MAAHDVHATKSLTTGEPESTSIPKLAEKDSIVASEPQGLTRFASPMKHEPELDILNLVLPLQIKTSHQHHRLQNMYSTTQKPSTCSAQIQMTPRIFTGW